VDHASVTISERRPLAILQVTAFGSSQQQASVALGAALNLELAPLNQMTSNASSSVRSLGPGLWQIVGDAHATVKADALRAALSSVASVVDLSHARTALMISGAAAERTLNKFCSLDLTLDYFAVGSATNTRFGHIGMTLSRGPDPLSFEILVFRSYAQYVLEVLIEAGAEFGLRVEH
jgi:sarcosine oxidase subunit gamma